MGVSDQPWGLNLPKWQTLKWWIHWDAISASSKRTEAKRCKKNMSILAARRCAWPSSLGGGAFLAHLIRDAVQIWYGFEVASTVSIDLGSKSYLLNYPDHMGIIVTNT